MEFSILYHRFLSQTVADIFAHRGLNYTSGKEKFIRLTDNFFDSLNVTTMLQGKEKKKDFFQPYEKVDHWRLGVSCCINQMQNLI